MTKSKKQSSTNLTDIQRVITPDLHNFLKIVYFDLQTYSGQEQRLKL